MKFWFRFKRGTFRGKIDKLYFDGQKSFFSSGRKTREELKSELIVTQRDDKRAREEITELRMQLREAYRDEEQY